MVDYTREDFTRALLQYEHNLDYARFSFLSFLTQYDVTNLHILKFAKKYMYGGKPVTRLKFYVGFYYVIQAEEFPEADKKHHIPKEVENRILNTLNKYGKLTTWQLASLIRKKLELTPEEKWRDYLGIDIDHYLHIERFKIIKKEI